MRVWRTVYRTRPPSRRPISLEPLGPSACASVNTRSRRATISAKIANAPQKIGKTSGYAGTSANVSNMGQASSAESGRQILSPRSPGGGMVERAREGLERVVQERDEHLERLQGAPR